MADHFKSSFDLPDDVAERLLKEACDEAVSAGPCDKPLAAVKLDILVRKTREYWDSVG